MSKIGIVSYCDHLRTYAHLNHQYYANQHAYYYIYDIAPTLHTPYKNKIEKLLKLLDLFDWVFWIDDDAFFLQYNTPLEKFIKKREEYDLIFCKSPINQGKWTYLSSGNFFLKNTPKVRSFLEAVLEGSRDTAAETWNEKKMGFFGHGEQEIMIYLLTHDERFNDKRFHTRYSYKAFNTRPFHFNKKISEHFLVHFTDINKHQQVLDFAQKFELSDALIPKSEFNKFHGIGKPGTFTGVAD